MWYSLLLLTHFNHTENNTACYVVQFIIVLIIQLTHVMWYSLLLSHFNHTGNNTACYVVTVYYLLLTLIIQETTQHVMWYSLLLETTHVMWYFNHTGNNTACYVVQFIIDSL